MLVTTTNISKGTLEALGTSTQPLAYMKVSKECTIEQMGWNRAATERGLEGVGVNARYTPMVSMEAVESVQGDAVMTGGKRWRKTTGMIRVAKAVKDIQLTFLGTPIITQIDALPSETAKLVDVMLHATRGLSRTSASRKSPIRPIDKADIDAPGRKKRGRPPKALKLDGATVVPIEKRAWGRPLGSKSKKTTPIFDLPYTMPQKQRTGRPKGSKNESLTTFCRTIEVQMPLRCFQDLHSDRRW